MAQRHYHVGHNMPGYCADDVYTVSSKAAARAAVAYDVKRYRESEWDIPRKDRRTASGSARDGRVYFSRPGDAYDLGYVYWWSGPCFDDECADNDND